MPFSPVPSQQGFSTLEIVVVVLVMVLFSAIALPSVLSWIDERKLNQGLAELEGAIVTAQQQAIRQSQTCQVNLPTGSNPTLSSTPAECLPTGNRTLTDLSLNHSLATPSVNFDFNGWLSPSITTEQTMVLSLQGSTTGLKCLVMAPGIGLIRVGNYTGAASTTVAANCETS
jgi:type II secretory pathway pseudopilin PulG